VLAEADPLELEAVAEYDVLVAGAEILIEHAVDEIPLFQAHAVGAFPVPQVTERLTVVVGATAVLGLCVMLQFPGAVPLGVGVGSVTEPEQTSSLVGAL
jgi:hypothetical protein